MNINNRILCVDDEVNVLDAFRRTLRKDFDVSVAESGDQALAMIRNQGPFALVLSDMRMPGMNGIQLLTRIKEVAPETVRMMLTGNSDQQTAMDAVNQGSIFRFLTKPCQPDDLTGALRAGIEQYRLITAEKQLLEQTLNQSIQALLDILAIVNPTAFSRSGRVKKLARDIAERIGIEKIWEVEFAAMLSQIGCVAVPEEILQKVADRTPLSNRETGLYNKHPEIGGDFIRRIPRLENVAQMVADQNRRFDENSASPRTSADIGASILRAALDYDRLVSEAMSQPQAVKELFSRASHYGYEVVRALEESATAADTKFQSRSLAIAELRPGMYLDTSLVSLRGSTLLPSGQEITSSLILRLANLVEAGILADRITVSVPADVSMPVAASA